MGVVRPAVPSAGVQFRLQVSETFDLVDGVMLVKAWACACEEAGRCSETLNPASGSAGPDPVVASTGVLMLEFGANGTADGRDLLVSSVVMHGTPSFNVFAAACPAKIQTVPPPAAGTDCAASRRSESLSSLPAE